MAKKAKLVVKITIEDSRRESPQVIDGNGSYAVIASRPKGDDNEIYSLARISKEPVECEAIFLSALKLVGKMIGDRPYLMGLLFDYLEGNVGDEIFKEPPREVPKTESAGDDQSEEPKAETVEADEAEAAEGGDDGKDH